MMNFNILATGSKGNAVIFEDMVMVDCGVSYKTLKPYVKGLKLILLTHIHGDHFNKTTIKKLASDRPTLRFGAYKWLVQPLLDCGVKAKNIDVFESDKTFSYGPVKVNPFMLHHDVPNCGYKLTVKDHTVFYATDTENLNGVEAKNFELYLIEANYEDEEIQERIAKKELEGQFAYEKRVLKSHLSKAKADNWLAENMGPDSEFVYMHCHEEAKE